MSLLNDLINVHPYGKTIINKSVLIVIVFLC